MGPSDVRVSRTNVTRISDSTGYRAKATHVFWAIKQIFIGIDIFVIEELIRLVAWRMWA